MAEHLVVPTTHWDRAWYWTADRFRTRLIEMFHGVEALWRRDPAWRFTLDGQSIALEDYLEVFPEKTDLYRRMGEAGRFRMGPYYVQNDWWCTGAEALIRNVLIGRGQAARFAAVQTACYMPDTFGFPASLPMFARGFGSDCAILMRGVPLEVAGDSRFLRWQAPDGSEVRLLRLRDGYANAARLGYTDGTGEVMDEATRASGIHPAFRLPLAVKKLGEACRRLDDGQGEPRLLLAGVDHQIPQQELPEILAGASDGRTSFSYADLDQVAAVLRGRDAAAWPLLRGECNQQPLGGTVATRIHLKLMNAEVESLLAGACEPAAVALAALGAPEPAARLLPVAWKRLITAHPHDDITGCGVDAVHRETELNMVKAGQAGDGLQRRLVWDLIHRLGGQKAGDQRQGFVVLETGARGGARRVRVVLDHEGRNRWGDAPPPPAFRLVDESGADVPFREVRRWRSTEHPHIQLELELCPALRPLALTRVFLEPVRSWPAGDGWTLANAHLSARVNPDATVDLTAAGRTWRGLGVFGDQADIGDEYTYGPRPGDAERLFRGLVWRRCESRVGGGMQAIVLAAELDGLPVEVCWSLAPDERQLSCRIRFTNTRTDHRLRWCLPLPQLPKTSDAAAFCSRVARPVEPARIGADGWLQVPQHPCDALVAVRDGAYGLAVFTPCPLLYEVADEGDPRLALTILRAVGMLSVSAPMPTRGPGAGPDTPTPEAQCLRSYDLGFAIRPFAAAEEDGLYAEALAWRQRPAAGVLWGADPTWDGAASPSLLELADGPVVLHALKPGEAGGSVLRLFNASRQPQTARLSGPLAQALRPCDLLERVEGEALRSDADGAVTIALPPLALRSFLIP